MSGLFGGIIFHHNWLGAFAWVALVPYFMALWQLRGRYLVWGTYIFGFTWYYLSLWWLHTLTVFHWIIPAGVLALSVIEATYFLAFAFPASWAIRRLPPWLSPWVIGAMWPGMEFLRTWTDFAFPWNFIGLSQAPAFTMRGIINSADLWGVYGVSFVLVVANAIVPATMRSVDLGRRPTGISVLALLVLIVVLINYGSNFNSKSNDAPVSWARRLKPDLPIKLAVIQPNISQIEKWDATVGAPMNGTDEEMRAARERYLATERKMRGTAEELMRQAATEKPQLYILPETAFLSPFFPYDTKLHADLHNLAKELGGDIFFGADNRQPLEEYQKLARRGLRSPSPDGLPTTHTLPVMPTRLDDRGTTMFDWEREPKMAIFNSAWQVKPDSGLTNVVYNKVELVPFGEMTPLVGGFEWFQDKLAIAGQFNAGLEYTTFETSGVRYGAVICFESAFSSLTSGLARGGAQMLCVLTNDSWYNPDYLIERGGFWGTLFKLPGLHALACAGPKQHFAHSVFRAIETRLPLVRAANNGISAVISPGGMIAEQRPYDTQGMIVTTVHAPRHELTFYARYGDWFAWLCFGVLLLIMACQITEWRRQRHPGTAGIPAGTVD